MTNVRTTHRSFRLFCFPTIPFHLLHVIALAHDRLTACAETPIGSVPAVVANVRPSVVTIPTRGVPTTPTQAQSGSGVGGVLRHYYPVGQHQKYNLGDFWHSLRPSADQPTLQLTLQRRNAQSTISLQSPSLPKAVP